MTKILEIRNRLFRVYGQLEIYLFPVVKFFVALAVFTMINKNIGYMKLVSTFPMAFLLSLVCCIIPVNGTIFAASVLILLDMYAVSMEVAIVTLIVFLLIYLIYFRFAPKNGMSALITPICFHLRVPYIMPVASGLLGKVYSILSVVCGTVVFYFLSGIRKNFTTLNSMTLTSDESASFSEKIKVALNQLINNREMYLVIVIFVITSLVVWLIRRMNIDYAWPIAIVAGNLIQFIGMISGFAILQIRGRMTGLILGEIASLLIAFFLNFLLMDLDYARAERVQFEDDEYYYYVRAVPKKLVSAPEKTVKHFGNTASMGRRIEHRKPPENRPRRPVEPRPVRKEVPKEMPEDEPMFEEPEIDVPDDFDADE